MGKYPVRKYEGLEIDREALAKIISGAPFPSQKSISKADKIISTMPLWLKGVKNETK